ncbi:MAG: hypothetical protein AAF394_00795 [Planctomycetota bacterium]
MDSLKKSGGGSATVRRGKRKQIIGADEAGYGPNLGPLLIAASVWDVPVDFNESDFDNLSSLFAAKPYRPDCKHIPLADSKKLFSPAKGIQTLETGLLAMLGIEPPADCQSWCENLEASSTVSGRSGLNGSEMPWYDNLRSQPIPALQANEEVRRLSKFAEQVLSDHEIELPQTRFYLVSEKKFNEEVAKLGSKGQLLSLQTLHLVVDLLSGGAEEIEVFCDRQGGRKNYMPVLSEAMPEQWFQEVRISSERCTYRNMAGNLTIHFSVGGDSFPPTALASMMAKYTRERMMEAFNSYWAEQVPGIKPTAGYPVDAARFRSEIESKAKELQLLPESWWRMK